MRPVARQRSVVMILLLGIGSLVAVFAASALAGAMRARAVAEDAETLTGRISAMRAAAFEVEINAEELASATRAHLENGDQVSVTRAREANRELLQFFTTLDRDPLVSAEALRTPLQSFGATADTLISVERRQRALLRDLRLGLERLDSILDAHVQRTGEAQQSARPELFQAGEEMEINLVELAAGLWDYLDTHHPNARAEIANDRAGFERFLQRYQEVAANPAERGWGDEIAILYRQHVRTVDEVLGLEDRKRGLQARFSALEGQLDSILDREVQPAVEQARLEAAHRAMAGIRGALVWTTGGLIISLVVGILVARATLGAVTRPLRELVRAADRMREGTFDTPIGALPTAEFGKVARSFDRMAGELSTALRELEEARDTAESASRRKTEFVSEVSHELRTPLTAIRASLGLLSGGAAGALPPAMTRLIEVAKRNSERLSNLIDDTLDLDRLEAGADEIVPVRLDPAALISAALDATRARALERSVQLGDEADAPPVLGDGPRLERVLINLISNAVKYAPPGSTVQVRALVGGGSVRFEVEDAGPGIPEAHQPRIFQRFARAGGARDPGGTGLGLALAKAIVEQHGGHIGFESRPGRTLFWFAVPRASEETLTPP